MLDINYIRINSDQVKQACVNKNLDPQVVAQLLAIDEKRRQLQQQVDDIRRQANTHADTIKQAVAQGSKPTSEQIETGRQFKTSLQSIEPELKDVQEQFTQLMYQIPNIPAADVPIGKDETYNQVVRQEGQIPQFDFAPKPHQELMEALNLIDTKQAVEIGGFRSYFLKNEAVLLEQALLRYALDLLYQDGFSLMTAPVLVNEKAMWGTGFFPWGKEDHYQTQDDQILAGTAEVAVTSFYSDQVLAEKDLPIKMAGISPCFRREVGSYGKDTQGIIRVHQFMKVEQVVYTIADETVTADWHLQILSNAEKLLQNLGLPYQVLKMCSGDMGAGQRKKFDLETWFPAQQKYRETHSASYFNDFQARRLNIKYQAKDGTTKYVYTMNNTMAASPRLLAAIIENYQQADGTIKVPQVLQPYLNFAQINHRV